jgi:hypothetical protein
MNHQSFWETYIAINSESESQQFLKDYLFSLPPDEMTHWLLSNTQAIVEDLKGQLQDPSVSAVWKADFKAQLQNGILNIQNFENLNTQRKAA